MKYVRYKLDKFWFDHEKYDNIKVVKGGVYLFPYFVDDSYNLEEITQIGDEKFWLLCDDIGEWDKEFEFISRKEYLKETKVPLKTLNVIIELFKAGGRDNLIIGLEIYKLLKINEHRYV